MKQLFILTALLFLLVNCASAQTTYHWAFTTNFDRFNDFDNGLAIIQQGRERGFMDTTGRVFITPRFHIIDAFSENVASAGFTDYNSMDSKSGYIDRSGAFVIEPEFQVTSPMHEGIACVKYRGLWGYIDHTGEWLLFPKFEEANIFDQGYAAVRSKGKWGVINKRGEFIVDNDYEYLLNISDGLFAAKLNGSWGFIDMQSQFKIKAQFGSVTSFNDGTAVVEKNGKYGIINIQGDFIIAPQYDALYNFSHDLAAAEKNGKWGYLNRKGEWFVKAIYQQTYPFSEELGRVKTGNKFGYLNLAGELTIPAIFNRAYDFHDQLARVYTNDKQGYIRYILPPPPETEADKPNAKPEEITQRRIKPGTKIKVTNSTITIRMFDYKKIDGDIVSINYQGSWLFKDYTLAKKPVEFTIDLDIDPANQDKNYLLFYAMNLGRNPPNTAQLTIIDGDREEAVTLEADLNTCDIIYFDYQEAGQ